MYKGFLVKVGSYNIPFEFIEANTLKPVIHGQDLDSYVNANGILKRNALDNVKPTVEWNVPAPITESELRPFMDSIQEQYISSKEKSANITAFYPEIGREATFKCYVPDIEFTIDTVDNTEITYASFKLKFIAYGGELT